MLFKVSFCVREMFVRFRRAIAVHRVFIRIKSISLTRSISLYTSWQLSAAIEIIAIEFIHFNHFLR